MVCVPENHGVFQFGSTQVVGANQIAHIQGLNIHKVFGG
jgi:hypothetical protein